MIFTILCALAVLACAVAAALCLIQMKRLSRPPICRICGQNLELDEDGNCRCEFCGEPYEE